MWRRLWGTPVSTSELGNNDVRLVGVKAEESNAPGLGRVLGCCIHALPFNASGDGEKTGIRCQINAIALGSGSWMY